MSERPRLFFLDNLRAVVIVLVIVLHASITYMAYPPTWWYVLDPHQSVFFTWLVLLIDVPIMPALFFVAGYFALPSIERHGTGGFLREKLVRVAAPWVFGVIFLAPLVTYMTDVSRNVQVGYIHFWLVDFWGPMYEQSVYWFLGVLFAAFLVLAWVYEASPRLRASVPRIEQPRTRLLVAFVAATAAGSALLAPNFGLDDWYSLTFFVVQPARVAFYVGYFALGVYAERRGWFSGAGFRPEVGPWGWGCVLTGITYLAFRMNGTPVTVLERALAAVLFSAFCFTALLAGLAVFQRAVNGGGRAWRTLAGSSYGIYYVHPLILFPLAYVLVSLSAPSLVKVSILVVVTFVASLAVSALLLKRLPGLRRAF
ncbi:MAG: acyltransferase family protein [Candidatus Limnocylindrales bacterium]